MKKFILGICVSLTIACAPELRDGSGERCDELSACGEGFECYRGYCVATERASDPDPIVEGEDGGVAQSGVALDAGGGVTPAARGDSAISASASKDAGSANNVNSGADDEDTPASKPASASPPAVTSQPATTSDAGAPGGAKDAGPAAPPPDKKPAPQPNPPPATMPSVPDAGARPAVDAAVSAPVDAAVSPSPDAAPPVVVMLPKNCTMQECCEEALRIRDNSNGNGNMGKGGKSCGCSDPALVTALLGTLTCTLGGVVGGLL